MGILKKQAKKKKNAIALLFDNRANNLPDEVLIMWINQSRSFSKGSIYILNHNQQISKIRQAAHKPPVGGKWPPDIGILYHEKGELKE